MIFFCNPFHEWQEVGDYFICKGCGMIKEKPKKSYTQPINVHPYPQRWQAQPPAIINQAFHGIPTQY